MWKKLSFSLLLLLGIIMAVATFIEASRGTAYAADAVYGTWWFASLWGLLVVFGLVYACRQHLYKRPLVFGIHLSLVLILLGAGLTHLTSRSGSLHLRTGQTAHSFLASDSATVRLPFALTLDTFEVVNHAGTAVAANYVSTVGITGPEGHRVEQISMNHILRVRGFRFYQQRYDADGAGSTLSVAYDPWGIGFTYAGYAALFLTMFFQLLTPGGRFRRLLREQTGKTLLLAGTLMWVAVASHAQAIDTFPTLDREQARAFGNLLCDYQGRIAPVETFAQDFTMKLSRRSSLDGVDATQILAGFLFFFEEWQSAPVVYVKDAALRKKFGLPEMAAYLDFFDLQGNYKFLPYWNELQHAGNLSGPLRAIAELDEKIQLLQQAQEHSVPQLFPLTMGHTLRWVSGQSAAATSPSPEQAESFFAANILRYIAYEGHMGGQGTDLAIEKIAVFQQKHGAHSLPSHTSLRREHMLNRTFSPSWAFRLALTLGLLFYVVYVVGLVRGRLRACWKYVASVCATGLFAYVTYGLTLRTLVAGRLPLGNGYETMLAIAWCLLAAPLVVWVVNRLHRQPCFSLRVAAFSLLLGGFALLVANLSYQNPAITPLVPVLSSPLLTLHVSVIMMAYALLSFTMLNALTAFLLSRSAHALAYAVELQRLTLLLLYPALFLLAVGIFVGAVWANVSWGCYWSWDPKEVWALITFLSYSFLLHDASFPVLRQPLVFHLLVLCAFMCVLMTYFGVNYFLGGMHSYA